LWFIGGENPAARVKKPKKDNQGDRFLSHGEAAALLKVLAQGSQSTHDAAAISLLNSMRFGENASHSA
ncbi:MAG: hypothetical protein LBT62_03060, partial [Deltaproteobacteria bacterium]|jgi:hypothetical protein|nr:hypothetical protein [Deltaproteobacteria bacterium]